MTKLAIAAIACAAMAAAVSPAQADTVTFEDVPLAFVGDGGSTVSGGFRFSQLGDFGGVANDAAFTAFGNAPTGSQAQYYVSLNDSAVRLRNTRAGSFTMSGLRFAFVSAIGGFYSPGDEPAGLQIDAVDEDGMSHSALFTFGGADSAGKFGFRTVDMAGLGAWSSTALRSVTFSACGFDGNGGCTNPNLNLNQFAIDNLVLAAVPTPGSLALAALALGAGAFVVRRRRQG